MGKLLKGFAGKSILLLSVLVISLLSASHQAHAQENKGITLPTKLGEAVSSVYNKAVGATFTISKIEPDTKNNLINLFFTDGCDIPALRKSLKFLPPAPLSWHNSSLNREANILTLRGHFKPGQRYILILPEGFNSAYGKTYVKSVASFTMPDRDSQITFLDQGSVIERDSRQMLHVQLMNVSEVRFQGLHIPAVLIPYLSLLQQNPVLADIKQGLAQTASRLQNALGKDPDFRGILGEMTEDGQLFFSQQEPNVYQQFSIPLTFRKSKEKGAIELVQVSSNRNNQTATSPVRPYRITDTGLSYKLADDGLLIWTTSLHSGKPQSGASLFAFTTSREVVPLGSSDSRGLLYVQNDLVRKHASLKSENEGQIATKPLMLDEIKLIAAVLPNDQTFVEILPQGNVKPEGVEQSKATRIAAAASVQKAGEKAPVKRKKKAKKKGTAGQTESIADAVGFLRGHVFTERGIYRPGETVHFKGTVREYRDGTIAPPDQTTVNFRIVNSKNEEVYGKNLALSEFGTASDSCMLKGFYPLGTYTLSLKYGEKESEVATRTFEVQEFRQPRHYVEVLYKRDAKKDDAYVNLDVKKELLNCEISGKYYAGGPVKHGKVRWTIYHTKSDYSRSDHPGYSFGYPLEARTDLIESGESMLDEQGKIVLPVVLGKDVLAGKYGIEVMASVVDFDGRASSESAVYQDDPDYLVGISSHSQAVQPGENLSLNAMVINKKGRKIAKGDVLVQVLSQGWTYIQKRNAEGQLYNDRQQIWRKVLAAELPIKDDRVTFDFDFTYGGQYLVSFTYRDEDGREFVSGTPYTVSGYYDYDYANDQRDVKKGFERLSMSPEKTLYSAGETIKLYLNPHRPLSSCLVTMEQGKVIEYSIIELKPGQRSIELPVKDSFSPNVYISVLGTVARSSFPLYASQFDTDAPSFLFGTVNVEVKNEQQKIKISVNEDQKKIKALPGSQMTLSIATTDQAGKGVPSEVAIAVIDESILSMTGYETPTLDALAKFLLPLGVFTGDLRNDILRQTPFGFFRNVPLTGGDGEGKSSEAVTSKIRKDFNPVAYFNPTLRTDANGRASVTFTFPDTMTTYRVYAVACDKGSRFGSYQRNALVVKDFYLEPGLPAFLTRGDAFTFSVSAFNKTDKSGAVDFGLKSDQMLALSATSKSYPLGEFDRTLIPVRGTALGAGTTQMQFAGTFKDKSDTVEIKLPVNSGHVLGSDLVFGNFRRETQVNYALPKAVKDLKWEELGPDEVKVILTVSGSPFMRMSQGLRYFLRYPYGCVEQTSSGVLPLAAIRGIVTKGLIPDITIAETDKFIRPGIDRLFSMQTKEGGFGYWPGDGVAHKWGSLYALTALTRAGLAGYDLPNDRMSKGMSYLQDQIKASGRDEFTYRGFAAYILALNKALDRETFNKVFDSIDKQPREATMLVLMAGRIAGLLPEETVKARLRPVLERPWNLDRFTDEFYARYREPAISLLAANTVFPGDEIADRMAGKLLSGMNQEGIWTSTSDTGWSLAALSEYFSNGKSDSRTATVTIKQNGNVIETFDLDPSSFHTVALDPKEFLKNPAAVIASSTDQTILYKLALTFPRVDYARNGYSNGFEVHKSIKNTDGTNTINVGDIVEVKIKINIKKNGSNYVVLDDPLPAGFVAINSAIKTEEQFTSKAKKARRVQEDNEEGGDEGEGDGEYGEGFGWSTDWYWDPAGYYRFTPNFFEIRNDRILAFRNHAWSGIYEYSYYARAVCEGEFVMPSTKVQLMYDPDVVAYTPMGKVVIKGK